MGLNVGKVLSGVGKLLRTLRVSGREARPKENPGESSPISPDSVKVELEGGDLEVKPTSGGSGVSPLVKVAVSTLIGISTASTWATANASTSLYLEHLKTSLTSESSEISKRSEYSSKEIVELLTKLSGKNASKLLRKIQTSDELRSSLSRLITFLKSDDFPRRLKEIAPDESPEVFSRKLLRDLVEILEHPDRITQGRKGTCGATVAERALAERLPGEYVRILTDLLANGKTKLKNGAVMHLNPGGLHKAKGERDTRYLPSRVLQPSFTDFANGPFTYDDDKEIQVIKFADGKSFTVHSSGLAAGEEADLLQALFGANYKLLEFSGNSTYNKKILKELLKEEYRRGHGRFPVVITVNFVTDEELKRGVDGGHFLELKEVEENSVILSNPWGESPKLYEIYPSFKREGGPPREPDGSGRWGYIRVKDNDLLKRLKPLRGANNYLVVPEEALENRLTE